MFDRLEGEALVVASSLFYCLERGWSQQMDFLKLQGGPIAGDEMRKKCKLSPGLRVLASSRRAILNKDQLAEHRFTHSTAPLCGPPFFQGHSGEKWSQRLKLTPHRETQQVQTW